MTTATLPHQVNVRHWKTADGKPPSVWWKPAPEMVRFEDWDTAAAIDAAEARRCREMGLIEVEMPRGVLCDGVRIFRRAA